MSLVSTASRETVSGSTDAAMPETSSTHATIETP
jgi:hypothetical protein